MGVVHVMKTSADQMDYSLFMEKALGLAERALWEGEFPVGCILVYENNIIASGYRTGTRNNTDNEIDHAEIVALRDLSKHEKEVDKSKTTLFCTMEPCLMCFGAILLSGIKRIVYAYEDVMGGGTNCDLSTLPPLYRDQQISIVPDILRERSLNLFKEFFQNPGNVYWKDSPLAEYTLSQ